MYVTLKAKKWVTTYMKKSLYSDYERSRRGQRISEAT